VLLALSDIQEKHGNKAYPGLFIEVFLEGTLFINSALRRATCCRTKVEETKNEDGMRPAVPWSDSETLEEQATENAKEEMVGLLKKKWEGALLISILAKIGLEKPTQEYLPFLKEVLSYPECVGVIAGKPGFAYYVVGHVDDYLVYLDPHFVQETVPNVKDLKTYRCSSPRFINYSDIDTSIAINFLIKDADQFQKFIEKFKKSCKDESSFLGVEIEPPKDEGEGFESVGDEDDFIHCGDDDEDEECLA